MNDVALDLRLPGISLRAIPVVQRNLRVWFKLVVPSLMANFGEPVLYLLALGYGLGQFIGNVQEMPYMVFLASGIVCSSAMNSASFEALYSAYTRMSVQRTWEAMITTPLDVDDVVLGEVLWAGTKSLISVSAILVVASVLGTVDGWRALWVLPVVWYSGVCFAAMALVMTSAARSYDFFLYYMTLFVTPMLLLSGVFFLVEAMPRAIQTLSSWLPLTHVVAIVRPLMTGLPVNNLLFHIVILGAYGGVSLYMATVLFRRRLTS